MSAGGVLVAAAGTALERRLRRVPWGIEVQIWRLVETQTYPDSAANLCVRDLLVDETSASGAGALPLDEVQMDLPWGAAP